MRLDGFTFHFVGITARPGERAGSARQAWPLVFRISLQIACHDHPLDGRRCRTDQIKIRDQDRASAWISDTYRERPSLQKPIHPDKLKQLLGVMLSHRKR
jgi:hypothetical protein